MKTIHRLRASSYKKIKTLCGDKEVYKTLCGLDMDRITYNANVGEIVTCKRCLLSMGKRVK